MERRLLVRANLAAIILLAAGGAWVCGTLLKAHGGGWGEGGGDNGLLLFLCDSSTIPSARCGDVVDSRWGSFDFTIGRQRIVIPTSFVGLAYFAAVALWFAVVGGAAREARWTRFITLMVPALGLISAAFFTGVMILSLDAWCPLCVVAHAINVLIFGAVLVLNRATGREPQAHTPVTANGLGLMPTACAVIALAVGGLWLYYDASSVAKQYWRETNILRQVVRDLQHDEAFVLDRYWSTPVVDIPLRESPASPNADSSAVSLVIFSDFQCSACACFAWQWQRMIEPAFEGALRVEYRHCVDSAATASSDDHAGRAIRMSYAAEAARLQGGEKAFRAMHNLLLRHRKERPGPNYNALARRVGLDVGRFLKDMEGQTVRRIVAEDADLAKMLGVDRTPAVFLDGRRVPDMCLTSRVFWEAMASEWLRHDEVALVRPAGKPVPQAKLLPQTKPRT